MPTIMSTLKQYERHATPGIAYGLLVVDELKRFNEREPG